MSMAAKALSIAMGVKRLLNVEHKFHDVNVSLSSDTTGAVSNLTLVNQGDGVSSRDGNSIKAESIYVRMRATINSAATIPCSIRTILFIDTQQQGTAPVLANVLVGDLDTPLNIEDFPGRFKVLRDHEFNLSPGGNEILTSSFYVPLSHHLKYDGVAGTAADQRKGQLYLLNVSNVATNLPTLNVDSRLRFIDN